MTTTMTKSKSPAEPVVTNFAAEREVAQKAADAPENMPEVSGWAHMGIAPSIANPRPCLVVSPQAGPAELIAWAHGECGQLDSLMTLLLDSSDDERLTKLAGVVENTIMQVLVVLEEAVKRLPKT